jgi:prolyl 4-hydroxylase
MVIKSFSPEWKLWIWSNVTNGYDRESIFNVLLNNGFDYNLIKQELEIEPTNTLVWQRQYTQENLNQAYEVELYPYNKALSDNPRAYRIENNFVEIYHFPEILTLQESDDLVEIVNKKLGNKKVKDSKAPLIHTLDTKSEICKNINQRLSQILGFEEDLGEDIYIQKFTPEFEYVEKYDFTLPNEVDDSFKTKGHKAWSVQITLNNITEGGHLTFNSIDRSIKPVKGDGVIWKNIYHDVTPNPYSKHTYLKTTEGDKYVLFKHYRQTNGVVITPENKDVQEIEIELSEVK